MRIVLKDLSDEGLALLKEIKKDKKHVCSRYGYECDDCPLKFLDCDNFDEQKIKINKKKRKAVLTAI